MDVQPPPWEKWSITESILDHPGEAKCLGGMWWHSKGCPFASSALRHTAQPSAKPPQRSAATEGPGLHEDQPVLFDYQQTEDARKRGIIN